MQTNEQNLAPKTVSSMISLTETNNKHDNLKTNEISQLFNKVYDSNFLSMINELSICIQNFHKYYLNYSNIIKTLFNGNEDNNDNLEQFKYNFNQIDSLSSKFYSDAKLIFKKMKIYRSNIIKNNNQLELKVKHKKSVSINYNIDKINNKLPILKEEINNTKLNNMGIDDYNIKNNLIKESHNINENFEKKQIDNINLLNYDSNNSSRSNIAINSFNRMIGEDLNNSSDKSKDDKIMNQLYENFCKNILSYEELINYNDDNYKLDLKEFLNGKKKYLINFIKDIINFLN